MAAVSAFKVKCPSCEAMVTIRDSNLIGKKVDCPKCKFRFVVEAQADSSATAESAASPKEGAAATTTATAANTKEGKAKAGDAGPKPVKQKPLPSNNDEGEAGGEQKQAKKKSNMTLYVGGGIGVLAIAVLVVYFAFFGDDGPPKPTPNPGKGANVGKGAEVPRKMAAGTKEKEKDKNKDPDAGKKDPEQPVVEKPLDPIAADITNMLPEDSQLVLRVDGKEFLETPIGGVFFDDASDSAPAFRRWMGFGGNNVERFACAVTKEGAFFGVVRLNKDLKLDDLKAAMELEPTPKVIRKRELWTVKSNELFTMLGDYLAQKIKELNLPVPKAAGSRTLALTLIDPKTLVVGDQSALDRFLEANLKRNFQMVYEPPDALPPPKVVEEKKDDPKAAKKKAKKAEPKPNELKEDLRAVTSNPSYLSVDPRLKIMINLLDTERTRVLALAVKIPDGEQPGVNILKRFGGFGVDVVSLPKTPVVGLAVRQMDDAKLNAVAAIEYPKADEVLPYVQNIQIASTLATALSDVFKVPVRSTSGDPIVVKKPVPASKKILKKFDPTAGLPPEPPPPPTSTVSMDASDKYLMIAIDIDWKPVYLQFISNAVRSKVDLLKGEALMLSGHAYWRSLPAAINMVEKSGTIPFAAFPRPVDANRFNVPYRPEQRVSWMTELLPYLGYEGLRRRIKPEMAWDYDNPKDGESNLLAGSAWIPEFLSHDSPNSAWRAHVTDGTGRQVVLGATNFVGLTGIGMDSGDYPDKPEYAKKLGLFGNERQTKIADVSDGLANTIFMIEVPPTIQRPWIRGGGATAQGVLETGSVKPFVSATKNGKRGTYALMADGSIRFISETINDDVFKALATYKGGEKIDNIDQIAPPENMDAKLVKPAAGAKK